MEKIPACASIAALLLLATSAFAQFNPSPADRSPAAAAPSITKPSGEYASDITVVQESQEQALEQAREMLEETDNPETRLALETAVQEMERASLALDQAGKNPDQLRAAIAAEQAAYQALLKAIPRERQISRSRNARSGGGAGQANPRQLDQLEMQDEQDRYETERQAASPQSPQQQERSRTADRLRQLAQRQQDLNERLRELQTALPQARTEQEREEIQRQLKRLRDEQRQMLADVDELRQQLDQSPDRGALSETRQQLDQARSDLQRAAQELEGESVSQALTAGSRAQERLQDLREDLRRRSASQFTEQLRQLRNQARELSRQQDEVARGLEALGQSAPRSLRDSPEREQLLEQMARQQDGLTNLLGGVRSVTEQAEATEPLLAHQLYETLRRDGQAHTGQLLEMGADLVKRGFLPQASEIERNARQHLQELQQGIERAAESVLGDELNALRFAQGELEELTRQAERELAAASTNAAASAPAPGEGRSQTNQSARAAGPGQEMPGEPGAGTNREPGSASAPNARNAGDQTGQQGTEGQPPGQGGQGGQPGEGQPQAGEQPGTDGQAQAGGQGSGGGGADSDQARLRQLAEQIGGRAAGRASSGGPVTGDSYMDWIDRIQGVEQALDSPELRNQLASVRERVGAFRTDFRRTGRIPESELFQNRVLTPMTQVRVWLREELARRENAHSLVPLDRDPVPDTYSELVRRYFEKLGSAP